MGFAEGEHIAHKTNEPEAWVCTCGNEPTEDGFYPCNARGNEVRPTPENWKEPLYVCARCGRIIHQKTLEVIGQNYFPHFLHGA
jgi:hypothetical protein